MACAPAPPDVRVTQGTPAPTAVRRLKAGGVRLTQEPPLPPVPRPAASTVLVALPGPEPSPERPEAVKVKVATPQIDSVAGLTQAPPTALVQSAVQGPPSAPPVPDAVVPQPKQNKRPRLEITSPEPRLPRATPTLLA